MIQLTLSRVVCAMMAVAIALLSACGGNDHTEQTRQTTVLVYMVGSDLESGKGFHKNSGGAATLNLNEMLQAQLPADANVVIETGGANQSYRVSPVPDWKSVRRYELGNGKLKEIANLGTVNMAQPETLANFIAWAKTAYPAHNYRLMLWDHGGGWTGYGLDENAHAIFSLASLKQAIQSAVSRTGIHFDVIGFDACLMATVEVADALSPYADYLLASQETEPGSGWNWQALVQNATVAPEMFGRVVIDSYLAKQAQSDPAQDERTTLSLVNLAKIASVETALSALVKPTSNAVSTAEGWLAVAMARNSSMSFSGADEVDLESIANNLAENGVATPAATALAKAVQESVVYAQNGAAYPDASGLSVFFPRTALSNARLASYKEIDSPSDYISLVSAFTQNAALFPGILAIDTTGTTSATLTVQITSTFAVRSLDRSLLSAPQADGTLQMIGTMPVPLSSTSLTSGAYTTPLTGTWLTLNGHPVVFADRGNNGADDPSEMVYFYDVPLEVDGLAVAMRVSVDAKGNYLPLGLVNAADDTDRFEPLPDSSHLIRTLGFPYDPTTNVLSSTLIPTSTAFQGGSFVLAQTALPSGYREGLFVTDYRGSYKLSAVFPRS